MPADLETLRAIDTSSEKDNALFDSVAAAIAVVTSEVHPAEGGLPDAEIAAAKEECERFLEAYKAHYYVPKMEEGAPKVENGKVVYATVPEGRDKDRHILNETALEEQRQAEEWYQSDEGKQVAEAMVEAFMALIEQTPTHGLPGHDMRHLTNDLTYGIRLIALDGGVKGYRTLGLIGSLMHDYGRLAEEATFGTTTLNEGGTLHAQLSYHLLAEMLAPFEGRVPQIVIDQLLQSVATHQGGNVSPEWVAQEVQLGDRMQLRGSEGLARFLQANAGMDGLPIILNQEPPEILRFALPKAGKTPESTMLYHAMDFVRRYFPQTIDGPEINEDGQRRRVELAAYILVIAGDRERQMIFAPEYARDQGIINEYDKAQQAAWEALGAQQGSYIPNRDSRKQINPIPEEVWKQAQALAEVMRTGNALFTRNELDRQSLSEIIREMVTFPNAGTTLEELARLDRMANEIENANPEGASRLKTALRWAIRSMGERGASDRIFLTEVLDNDDMDPIAQRFALFVLNQQNAPRADYELPAPLIVETTPEIQAANDNLDKVYIDGRLVAVDMIRFDQIRRERRFQIYERQRDGRKERILLIGLNPTQARRLQREGYERVARGGKIGRGGEAFQGEGAQEAVSIATAVQNRILRRQA